MSLSQTLIIGAAGQIGQLLCARLNRGTHRALALVRKEEQHALVEGNSVSALTGDLEGSHRDLNDAFAQCDRLVFTAGSGGQTGADKTLLVDLYGAWRCIELAEQYNYKQIIMVSALRAADVTGGPSGLKHYLAAKYCVDDRLRLSGISSVVMRPGRLHPGQGILVTGSYKDACSAADEIVSAGWPTSRRAVADLAAQWLEGIQPVEAAGGDLQGHCRLVCMWDGKP